MKTEIKIVVTHMDDFVVHFTLWEHRDEPPLWSKAGSLWMHKHGYDVFFRALSYTGSILLPTEHKLEVTDDDIPIEAKTQKATNLQETGERVAGNERELSKDNKPHSKDAERNAANGRREDQYGGDRKLKY